MSSGMSSRIRGCCLTATLLALFAHLALAAPIVVRDSKQQEVSFAASPKRVITLLPSLTESVCALGACSRLVATDRFSNWPAEVAHLPKVGGLEDAEIEQIVAVKPDVVLLTHAARVAGRLRALHLATLELDTQSYPDIARTITTLGVLLEAPGSAAALIHRIDSEVDAIAATARRKLAGHSPQVYYEVDAGPYAAGPESFIGDLLSRLGAHNIITPELGPFPKINPEYVVQQNPDVIFIAPTEVPHLGERPGWSQIRAVREKRLCSYPPEVRDTIVRPGPRVAEGLKALADCLERVAP